MEESAQIIPELSKDWGPPLRQLTEEQRRQNKTKSKVRAKVEHIFLVFKRIFRFNKVRYKRLKKNTAHVVTNLGLVNIYMSRRRPLRSMA